MKPSTSREEKQSDNDVRERGLISRIAAQDRDAFRDLYGIYQPRLFKFTYGLIQAYDAADELANDVMLTIWKGASKYRGAAKVSTWIFGIAYRQAMRRVSKKSLTIVADFDLDTVTASGNTNVEQEDWVRAGIDRLPTAQRAAVILVFYYGLSYEEAAAIAECPVNTIKTRMFHARRKLKNILEKSARPLPFASEKQHA